MNKTTYVSQRKLRRLAPRAVEILARYKDKAAQLGPYESTLASAAGEFAKLYDASRTAPASASDDDQALAAIEALRLSMRGWLGAVSRDIPGFDSASFTDRPITPDDVIGSGQRLLEVCRNHQGVDGKPLAYQAQMEQALSAAVETAANAWAQDRANAASEQELRDQARAAAVQLHRELVAFRRALRTVVGTSHVDYRALRVSPSPQHDDNTEVLEESTPVTQPLSAKPLSNGVSNGAAAHVTAGNGASAL